MLSVVVLTKNEETVLTACLESVKFADEIIIVDQGSTDRTIEIAKKYTAKIFVSTDESFAVRRTLGNEKATGEWILHIDADERATAAFKEEVLEVMKSTKSTAYAIRRTNIIFGKEVHYGPYKDDLMIRMVRKDAFKGWEGNVHEHLNFTGLLGYFGQPVLHLTHRDLDHFVLKSLEWSKTDALLRLNANHPPMTKWRFMRILITETYNQGIKRKGFFGGTVGIIDSMLQVFFLYMSYVRLYQMQQNPPIEKVYEEIDRKLIENGFDFEKTKDIT